MKSTTAAFTLLAIIGLCLSIVVCCFCAPVSATTISLSYAETSQYITSGTTTGSNILLDFDGFIFEDITTYSGLKTIVIKTGLAPFGSAPDWTSKSTEVTLKIGSTVVGSGEFTATNVWKPDDTTTDCIGVLELDYWDVSGYSGQKTVIIYWDDSDFNDKKWIKQVTSAAIDSMVSSGNLERDGDGKALVLTKYNGYYSLDESVIAMGYNDVDFTQSIDYEDYGTYVDLTINKNGYGNQVEITSNSGYTFFASDETDDVSGNYYDVPIWVNVTNPYTLDIWSNLIPEESEVPSDQTALVHSYVYDAVTGSLINGMTITTDYDGGGGGPCSWPGGVAHTTLDWSYDAAANLTASADGYENSSVHRYVGSSVDTSGIYLPAGEEITDSFYLMPTGSPTNTTYYLTFEVSQEVSPNSGIFFRSSDAAVTCAGEQRLTSSTGITWFNVTSGSYPYTVSKNGFEPVQGTVSVSGNTKESVALYLTQTEPTPITNVSAGDEEDPIHEGIEETYAELGEIIPGGVILICLLFLMKVIKKS